MIQDHGFEIPSMRTGVRSSIAQESKPSDDRSEMAKLALRTVVRSGILAYLSCEQSAHSRDMQHERDADQ